MREGHRQAGLQLSEEGARLQQEVNASVLSVSRLKSDYRRGLQSLRVTEELQEQEGDTVSGKGNVVLLCVLLYHVMIC